MKSRLAVLLACLASPALAQYPPTLDPADEAAAFGAAGFARQDGHWTACPDDVTASYSPGQITFVGDLNGDGQPEAVTSEDTTFCYGFVGTGYALVSRQGDGSWTLIDARPGIPAFLDTKGVDGWPDIEIGGPGFCFPVVRWNGREYALDRHQYEGKRCQPGN